MTLNEYQNQAMTTCLESSKNYEYMMSNLVGEVGEFNSKVAKAIRKGIAKLHNGRLVVAASVDDPNFIAKAKKFNELKDELMLEAGDCYWQLAGLCKVMGWDSETVCQKNLDKLQARKTNGTIDGSGDGVTKEERLK